MSRVADMLQAKNVLPPIRKQIFETLYQRGLPQQQASKELGLSAEEFEREHRAMLRSLRGVSNPPAGMPSAPAIA
jgi:DNA-directed RNA polymerase specialized sigma subunit